MSPPLRMGDFVPLVSITRGFCECCTTHSPSSTTTGTFLSTVIACLWPMARTGARFAWRYPSTQRSHGWQSSSASSWTRPSSRWHKSPSPPCVRAASLTPSRCQSRSSRFITKMIPCESIVLRLCLTLRALTSTLAWLRSLSTCSTCSTYRTTPPGPSSSSVCTWARLSSTPRS
jgi:hypothetical protein